jgi:hypothetical protein
LSCGLKGSICILEWHSDIYNGHRLAGVIDCNKVWLERPIKAWDDWLILTVVDAEALKAFTSLSCMALWRFVMATKFGLQWHRTCSRVSFAEPHL